jgi:hypothetical protein
MHGAGSREERERRGENFVAALNVERAQRKQDRVGAICASDRVSRLGQLCDIALETLDGLAENERLIVDDLHHRVRDGIANRRVLSLEIE